MTDADVPANGQWPVAIRVLWVVLVSPILCVAVGMVVGTVVLGTAALIGAPDLELLRALPLLPFYSLFVAAPFGAVAGVVGGIVASMLGTGQFRGAPRKRWVRSGVWAGGVVGVGCPLFLLLLSFAVPPIGVVALYAVAGGLAGALSGAAMGFIGWREFGSGLGRSGQG